MQVVDAPQTRANITILKNLPNFSTTGFRGTSSGNATTPWFHNADTNPNGTLVTPIQWSWEQPYGKFFAVAVVSTTNLNAKPTLSPKGTAAPYVDFEVKPKVVDQEDLMTACSGEVHYAKRFVAPTTNLKFRHALTAVRFKVGQNLSWNKTITKVEITGAKSKGRYMLPTDETGTGAQWTNLSNTKSFILGGDGTVNVSTSEDINNIIVGKPGDNFTFYMIPQRLTGRDVQVKVTLNDGKVLTSTLYGTWSPGTTKTYALTENQSNWNYVFTVVRSDNETIESYQTDAGTYTVQSYRNDNSVSPLVQQPVKWKVVSYQESNDGGVTWGTPTSKCACLSLNKTEGDGNYITSEYGSATVTKDYTDKLAEYNKVLHDAINKGSSGSPYDLSMYNYKGEYKTMNTANSYLISAPGYYKIPLVYGNAIKNGRNNTSSYQTANSGPNILQKFKDHAGADITSPYINVQNSSNPATQASIVWTDQSGIVEASSLSVTGSGQNSYLNFHVPVDEIKNCNAVIAVKNASGIIMWSWHLWFAHKEELETVKCTAFGDKDYNVTKQTLGFAYSKWVGSTYDKKRIVRVRFEQAVGQRTLGRQYATITIEQNPGGFKENFSTYYQFGRKDAFPGETKSFASILMETGDNMSITNSIQNPKTVYLSGLGWKNRFSQYNLWSMDNTTTGFNDNAVVKTIYDPCPAGFHMPASNAFSVFEINNPYDGELNVSGGWDHGWNFNNKVFSPDATVFFPALGYCSFTLGLVSDMDSDGCYWTAVPYDTQLGCNLFFNSRIVNLRKDFYRYASLTVRPVSE